MPLIHRCIPVLLAIFLLACIAYNNNVNAIRLQAVAAKGVLLCGSRPASGVKVKLFDDDDGPDPDDLLDEAFTDQGGNFYLKGSAREFTPIDPELKIYHDCDDDILPGQRRVKIKIPNQYITNGGVAKRTFDVGVLNMESIFTDEARRL